jgi:predicted metal-binding protein
MHYVKPFKGSIHIKGFNPFLGIINQKQILVCKNCHNSIHSSKSEKLKLSDWTRPYLAKKEFSYFVSLESRMR